MGGMEGIKKEKSEQQNDKAEKHDQHGLDLGCFEVQKVRFLILNAFCLYLELWFLLKQEAHFQKIHANKQKNGAQM